MWATPTFFPGGEAILLAADLPGRVDRTNIEVVTLADRRRRILVRGAASPRYVATSKDMGHLLYVSGATLFAVPFDLPKLEIVGNAVPIVNDMMAELSVGTGKFDISLAGTLIYLKAGRDAEMPMTLQWLDASQRATPWPLRPGMYTQMRLSPNGNDAALTIANPNGTNVWVYNSRRDVLSPLTSGGVSALSPLWSPDGQYIVFSSVANEILQARADGSTPPQVLVQNKANQYPSSFTPDGKRLAYWDSAGGGQIWTVSIEDDGRQLKAGAPEPFLTDTFAYRSPSFSPDGRWLAYHSQESGANEVFVRAFPPPSSGAGGRWQISVGGGTAPRWAPTGATLLYQSDNQIMAVPYSAKGNTFVAEKPRPWIMGVEVRGNSLGTQWGVSKDGKRVAVLKPVQAPADSKPAHVVVFLQNFFDELRRRAPLPR